MTPSSGTADALLRTPLYDTHRSAGARMVPFGGWEMPVQYRSIVAEHNAVRESVGLFDLSHMGRLVFSGTAGRDLLQRLSTNNVATLAVGRAHYGLLCNEQGGILDDTVCYNFGDEHLLVVNASNRLKILEWAARQQPAHAPAEIRDTTLETAMIGLQGVVAEATLQPLADVDLGSLRYYAAVRARIQDISVLVARTGYTGEDGFELIVTAADAARLWQILATSAGPTRPMLCGLGARDTLRLEAGMALYGHEISEETNPFEANLARVVKLDKDDFVGREALLRLSEQPLSRRLIGFQMVDGAVPRQSYEILVRDQVVGQVTSGSHSPTLNRNVGMAYVRADLAEPETEVAVVVRGRPWRARVVALPHVAHRTRRPARQSQSGASTT